MVLMLIREIHKKFNICHCWYFLDFKFQLYVCNGCHDILMMSINLNNIAISDIRGIDYRRIINGIDEKLIHKFTAKC